MEFSKRILRYLILATLLIASEAGQERKLKTKSQKPVNVRDNTQRGSNGRTNSGASNARTLPGALNSNLTPVQPGRQPILGLPSVTKPNNSRPPASGLRPTGSNPLNSRSPFVTTQNKLGAQRMPNSQSSTLPLNQIPDKFSTDAFSPQSPPSLKKNRFLTTEKPRNFYAESKYKKQQQYTRSPSTGSVASSASSVGFGGGVSSGYQSSESLHSNKSQPSVQNLTSTATPEMCVDNGMHIAYASNCFDYYKLAIIWSPGYAYKKLSLRKKIRKDKISTSWIVHGLWPSMYNQSARPMPNCRRSDIYFREDRLATAKLLHRLENKWYTLLEKKSSTNGKFWQHEFNEHGSCAARSRAINSDVSYFTKTLDLADSLFLSIVLNNAGYRVGRVTKLKAILKALRNKIKRHVKVDFVENHNTTENYLTEVYVCYDLNLQYIDCPQWEISKFVLAKDITLVASVPVFVE